MTAFMYEEVMINSVISGLRQLVLLLATPATQTV